MKVFAIMLLCVLALVGCSKSKDDDSTKDKKSDSNQTTTSGVNADQSDGDKEGEKEVECVKVGEGKEAGYMSGKDVPDLLKHEPTVEFKDCSDPPASLVQIDILEGTGDAVGPSSTVEVNYYGVLWDGSKPFDSSWQRGDTTSFSVRQVISGWTQGLQGMKVGGRRELVIPPAQGYGSAGSPPSIPPNSTLVFVVDLLGVS